MRTDLSNIAQGCEPMDGEPLLQIGRVSKADGRQGEVLVKVSDEFSSDLLDTDYLMLVTEGGYLPARVVSFKKRGEGSATIGFAHLKTASEVESIIGCRVCVRGADVADEDEETGFALLGYEIVDEKIGSIGRITDMDDRVQSNPLFVVGEGEDEILIPIAEDFMLGIDHDKRQVLMRLPDGLI